MANHCKPTAILSRCVAAASLPAAFSSRTNATLDKAPPFSVPSLNSVRGWSRTDAFSRCPPVGHAASLLRCLHGTTTEALQPVIQLIGNRERAFIQHRSQHSNLFCVQALCH